MTAPDRRLRMHEVVRYPKTDRDRETFAGVRNLFAVSAGGQRRISLDSGINAMARSSVSGLRPAILLSSAPWKAGTQSTPWHDSFDLDRGHVRYFGDHKATTPGPPGSTPGNAAMLAEVAHHLGRSPAERQAATPILIFRAVAHDGVQKGFREFCGVGVLETVQQVVQWDAVSGRSFTNFVYDVAVLGLGPENEYLDWTWVNDRRVHAFDTPAVMAAAPTAWRTWIEQGHRVLPVIRRRTSRSLVVKRARQLPEKGSRGATVLAQVYAAFAEDKHAFESLASLVVGRILARQGGAYQPGWITKASGDNGIDFVARLDLGSGRAQVKLVILGQAKCVLTSSTINAGDLARVVARLRRGWIGAYVTTGTYTEFAQQELADDEYPILLVDGQRLAAETVALASEDHGGDVAALLTAVRDSHRQAIVHRRPEEILDYDGVVASH